MSQPATERAKALALKLDAECPPGVTIVVDGDDVSAVFAFTSAIDLKAVGDDAQLVDHFAAETARIMKKLAEAAR